MIENSQRSLKKAQQVLQRYFICSMVVHCKTNCNEICPIYKKSEKSKKRKKCNKYIFRQNVGSMLNKLQRDLSNDRKKSEKSEKSATSVTKVFNMQYGG